MPESTIKRRIELLEQNNGTAKLIVVIRRFTDAPVAPTVVQNGVTIVYGSELDARL